MSRHPRFEDHRYLGDKRSFVAYDNDDPDQFALVEKIPLEEIASFAPDEPSEYRNRGFRALHTPEPEEVVEEEPWS